MLRVENVSSGYGPLIVLHGVSLVVEVGEIVGIIGANGAGKSTLLRTVSGALSCSRGKITFDGYDISNFPPHKVVKIGLTHVPEGRQIFAPLTTSENLLLGAYSKYHQFGKKKLRELLDSVFQIFPILYERRNQISGTLSGGEQQMLALGRGLMAEPKLLLLDELSLGLAPTIVDEICRVLQELNKKGLPILLVEQNAEVALTVTHRTYVMEQGGIVLEGRSEEIADNDKVKEIYLGR